MKSLRRFWWYTRALVTGRLPDTRTPLQTAAFVGDVDEVRRLLDTGADINQTDIHKITPLRIAISMGHTTVVSLLLDRGADPSGIGVQQSMALAEKLGRADVLRPLEAAGVRRDPNVHWNS